MERLPPVLREWPRMCLLRQNVHDLHGVRGFGLGIRDDCSKPICRFKLKTDMPSSKLSTQRAQPLELGNPRTQLPHCKGVVSSFAL
jgi:hypothetical protein